MEKIDSITGIVCHGHRGASGTGPNFGNTCEGGSIRAQDRHFIAAGVDLRDWLGAEPYWGTLNCYVGMHAIDPMTYIHQLADNPNAFPPDHEYDAKNSQWDYRLANIDWHEEFDPENFCLRKGRVTCEGQTFNCFQYYPDPATKPNNPNPQTIVELIAPPLPLQGAAIYGHKVQIEFPAGSLVFKLIPVRGGQSPYPR